MVIGCHCPYCKQLYKEEVDIPNVTVMKQIVCDSCHKTYYLTYNKNSNYTGDIKQYHEKE